MYLVDKQSFILFDYKIKVSDLFPGEILKTNVVIKLLFLLLFSYPLFSYGQYISVQSTSYNGNIYHTGGYLGVGTNNPSRLLTLYNSSDSCILRLSTIQSGDACKTLEYFYWDIKNDKNLSFSNIYTACGVPTEQTNILLMTINRQVGINTENIEKSAVFQINSEDRGILIPRLDEAAIKNISSPANGLLVFNSVEGKFQYYFNGIWHVLENNADLISYMTKSEFYNTVAGGITNNDTARWNEAFGWGNHAEAGYLTGESDPVFMAWDKDYNDLTNRPDFSGWDTVAADDFDGLWGSLQGTPPDISIFNNDVGYLTENDIDFNTVWQQSGNNVFLDNFVYKVGIGTSEPSAYLHIKGNTSMNIRLERVVKNKGIHPPDPSSLDSSVWDISNNGNLEISNFGTGSRKVIVNATVEAQKFVGDGSGLTNLPCEGGESLWKTENTSNIFYTNGNVGIGTSNPQYKLDIAGDMKINGRLWTTGDIWVRYSSQPWPDYVFEENYELYTPDSLEIYIKKYGHLPEVPSADDISKNGYKLNELDIILLKKVEELTLYIIELNKKIEELEKDKKGQNE